jgi:hypothetical protein
MRAIRLMTLRDDKGDLIYGQRDIERETGLSRPYLRKLATEIDHQFPRNGIEVRGQLCMCVNCGWMFRKPASRVKRAKRQFCDDTCRQEYMKGSHHPSWKGGVASGTFSNWVKNQAKYDEWVQDVMKRDNHTCQISGKTEDLHVHHVLMKAESHNPEKVFDVENGITLNREVHEKIHAMIREGCGFEESLDLLRKEYNEQSIRV